MPYEYKIDRIGGNNSADDKMEKHFNQWGAQNWRIVRVGFELVAEWELNHVTIYERKIEINRKMRDKQLGKENDDNDGKKSETEGD